MIPSAYVHVPFCHSICRYCAFEKSAALQYIDPWLEQICKEIRISLAKAREENPDFLLETIYFGGGTPSLLSPSQLECLCAQFDGYFREGGEWTVEANPESLDEEKLQVLKVHGVNRISIGIQTFDPQRLKSLGRMHSPAQSAAAVALCKQYGITNICADLMYGFPGQSETQLQQDLEAFLQLNIDHLSIYSLIVEPDSVFGRMGIDEIEEETGARMYEQIERILIQAGYEHYEVSSYARNKKYGLHNLLIWQDGFYFGFGPGAVGRNEQGLYHHQSRLSGYCQGDRQIVYEEDANPWFDAIMTGLRTASGVNLEKWQARYGLNFYKRYGKVLEKYAGKLWIENGALKVTSAGLEILDTILVDFLMED